MVAIVWLAGSFDHDLISRAVDNWFNIVVNLMEVLDVPSLGGRSVALSKKFCSMCIQDSATCTVLDVVGLSVMLEALVPEFIVGWGKGKMTSAF